MEKSLIFMCAIIWCVGAMLLLQSLFLDFYGDGGIYTTLQSMRGMVAGLILVLFSLIIANSYQIMELREKIKSKELKKYGEKT